MDDYDTDNTEDVDLHEVRVGGAPAMTVGIAPKSGAVYLRGDLHPLGSASALLAAARHGVPYIALSAVEVLYPSDWLKGECLHDADRLRVIANIENYARSGFSQGSRMVQ